MGTPVLRRIDFNRAEHEDDTILVFEEILQTMCTDGVVVVENAIPSEAANAILSDLEAYIQTSPMGAGGLEKGRRVGALVARSYAAHQAIAHPAVMHVCDQMLGRQVRGDNRVQFMQRDRGAGRYPWRVGLTQVIDISPGQERQGMHRGNGLWGHDFSGQGIDPQIETMWALTEFTEENGATHVIPKSHCWDDVSIRNHEKGPVTWFGELDIADVQATMSPGSVLIWTGWTVHGAGANQSSERRTGMNIDYTLAFLAQEENQFLACPPEVARELPEEIRQLIGYRQDGVALNYVADVQTPDQVIERDFKLLLDHT